MIVLFLIARSVLTHLTISLTAFKSCICYCDTRLWVNVISFFDTCFPNALDVHCVRCPVGNSRQQSVQGISH
jgi:hypothetical protein